MAEKHMLAADFGGSSGRVVKGNFDGNRISLEEIHRFANEPVTLWGKETSVMCWDFLRLFCELKKGILKAGGNTDSIGIDTWGVDYGLLDQSGQLLTNPIHYRDLRTSAMRREAAAQIEESFLYEITGSQFMEINTFYQLLAEKRSERLVWDGRASFVSAGFVRVFSIRRKDCGIFDCFHFTASGCERKKLVRRNPKSSRDFQKTVSRYLHAWHTAWNAPKRAESGTWCEVIEGYYGGRSRYAECYGGNSGRRRGFSVFELWYMVIIWDGGKGAADQ